MSNQQPDEQQPPVSAGEPHHPAPCPEPGSSPPSIPASEERYRAFIANSTEGIWRFDLEAPVPVSLPEDEQISAFYRLGFLAEANDAFARMYGLERGEELVGARLGDFLVRDDPANEEYLRALIRAGYRLSDAESVETGSDGRVRHFSNTLTGIVEGGLLLRAWGTQRDITAQRAAEARLRESEERFRALADNIAQLAWMADASGWIFWYNRRWFEYTGTTLEEMQGWGWQAVHHPDFVEAVTEKFRSHVERGEPWEDTFPLRGTDGRFRWFLSRAFPTRDAAGNVVLWCGTNTDVTEQRRAEDARRATVAQQRRFVREMLMSVTEGKLCLCDGGQDLPDPLPPAFDAVDLTPATLRVLRKRVKAVAEGLGLTEERVSDLLTAAGEAGMNAVKHGGGGEGRVHADPERRVVQVWIRDQGKGIREEDLHRATLEKGWSGANSLGHGFFLMLRTVDRTYLLTGAQGTTVVLEQESAPPQPAWLQAGRSDGA